MKRSLFALSLLIPFGGIDQAQAEIRAWTNLSGKSIQAEMIGMDLATRAVKVRLSDGREFPIPISTLSAADVAFAAAQWKQMQAGEKAPAATSQPGSGLALPPRYVSRCSDQARLSRLTARGAGPEVEAAIKRSLTWLKAEQNADGSWDDTSKVAHTGYALQCFTAHCETLDSPEYGDTVMKAAAFLIQQAQSNPHGALVSSRDSISGAYEHGIATTALGELYVLSKAGGLTLPGMKESFEKAVQLILEYQTKTGSWDYFTKNLDDGALNSTRSDLSLTHWLHQALLVARESGLPIKDLDAGIKKAVDYLESTQSRDGGFGRLAKDGHYNQWQLSGGAILGLQTLGQGNNSKTSRGIRFLRDFLKSEPLDWNSSCNLYSWAGYTPAFFHAGGEDWDFYKAQWLPQMLAAQQTDGSFKMGKANWPASHASNAVYRQALATLQLQVFYRYSNVP